MTRYLMCGLPFAGKSTLGGAIGERAGAVVVRLDDMACFRFLRDDYRSLAAR